MKAPPFLPLSEGLIVEQMTQEATAIRASGRSTSLTACCLLCAYSSESVHSQYVRTVADLPCGRSPILLQLIVRRFFCRNPLCTRRIFAEPLFQRALRVWEQARGPHHPKMAESLNGLAELSREQGRYAEADPLYRRALSIREQQLGQHHPLTAQTLHDLAIFRQKQGNLSEALSLAERALQIRSQALGNAHPNTVATRALYTQLVQGPACTEEVGASAQSAKKQPVGRGVIALHQGIDTSLSENDHIRAFLETCCELLCWLHGTSVQKARAIEID
jgi:tetratricopeptide (TPR) repeat protein